jgi:peptidoglycan/xylan/chitin deacetylase (PgdA/CDA1 family)
MSIKTQLYRQKEKLKRRIYRGKHGHCTVLLYHRVIDLKYDPQLLCVSPDNFENQLSTLKKEGIFLDIEEFTDILSSGKNFPKNSFLITFDDGYADNLVNAVPLLNSLNLPSVFYISTAGIGTEKLMWWDELDLVFKNLKESKNINELLKKYGFSDSGSLYRYYLSACKTAKSLEEREHLLTEIRSITAIDHENKYRMLSLEEFKRLGSSKQCTIGAHTVNHLSLAHLNIADKEKEIIESIRWLKEKCGSEISHFSFPYGERNNYDEATLSICKASGMKSAAANYQGYVSKGTDVFSFPRFVVRNDSPEIVLKKMQGIL